LPSSGFDGIDSSRRGHARSSARRKPAAWAPEASRLLARGQERRGALQADEVGVVEVAERDEPAAREAGAGLVGLEGVDADVRRQAAR
jgi:hypothetical protein